MSQDLFAAFEEAAPLPSSSPQTSAPGTVNPWASPFEDSQTSHSTSAAASNLPATDPQTLQDDEDDFGDFEDAQALAVPSPPFSTSKETATPESITISNNSVPPTKGPSDAFPPKTQKREDPPPHHSSKIGRHPFADHMDLLFSGGDDEYDAGDDELEDLSKNPEAAMAYSKRMIAEQTAQNQGHPKPAPKAALPAAPNPPTARNKLQKRSGYVPAKDSTVLFDADNVSEHDYDDEDDFGDFEETPASVPAPLAPKPSPAKLQKKSGPPPMTRQQRVSSKPSLPSIDLLGLNEAPLPAHSASGGHLRAISQNSIMSPRSERAESILGYSKADSFSRPPNTGSLLANGEEAWDDFETFEPTPGSVPHHSRSRTASSSILPTRPVTFSDRSRTSSQDTLPPTNIPPPVILLSIFPSLFASAQDALFNPLSKLEMNQRRQLLGHPATHQFLRGYLNHGIVLAHIIAGRKLRWKRDQILAQSMRIGPSAAGGKGGMKLSSIDKSEQIKEDREVTDVLAQWKAQAGKLRGAVASASTTTGDGTPKLGIVPEIMETMPIKSLKSVEGGFTAPHPCALCGLKREERIGKIDVEINDSFGEWWVNGMDMHVACRNWWDENKGKLKSR